MVCYIDDTGKEVKKMKDKKVNLKKINKVNNSTVKTLDCHCGCQGHAVQAVGKGYMGAFL